MSPVAITFFRQRYAPKLPFGVGGTHIFAGKDMSSWLAKDEDYYFNNMPPVANSSLWQRYIPKPLSVAGGTLMKKTIFEIYIIN